jgi:predicted porin
MKPRYLVWLILPACSVMAHAEGTLTLFGIADGGLGYTSNVANVRIAGQPGRPAVMSGASAYTFTSGTMSGSRWGLQGVENLGGGLSAIFDLESGVNLGTGRLNQGGREFGMQSWMGLNSTQYGKLTLGRVYDPIVDFVGTIGPSFYLTGVAAHPGDLDNIDNQSRESNAIKYVTPKLAGFQFGGLYAFGGQPGSVRDQSTWSVGGKYTGGPFAFGVAYLLANNAYNPAAAGVWTGSYDGTFSSSINVGFQSARTMQIVAAGSTYQLDAVTLGVTYSNVQFVPGTFSLFREREKFNSAGVTASWNVSAALRVAAAYSYTRGGSIAGSSPPIYNQWDISSFYSLSKRTVLYGLVGYQHARGATLDAYGNIVAATASVGDTANGMSSEGPNQAVVRIGLHHAF